MKKGILIKSLLGVQIVTGFLIAITTITLSWFHKQEEFPQDEITASCVANYFASGDGSEEDPFILNQPQHVYNLAWLQNDSNFLYQEDSQGNPIRRYFKLGADIDMAGSLSGGAVPPIGTTAKPFTGYFDGDDHVISNLWVSTDPDDWEETPEDMAENTLDFSGGVGMFGVVTKDPNEKTIITQLYL